jgi:hypothetical protein
MTEIDKQIKDFLMSDPLNFKIKVFDDRLEFEKLINKHKILRDYFDWTFKEIQRLREENDFLWLKSKKMVNEND